MTSVLPCSCSRFLLQNDPLQKLSGQSGRVTFSMTQQGIHAHALLVHKINSSHVMAWIPGCFSSVPPVPPSQAPDPEEGFPWQDFLQPLEGPHLMCPVWLPLRRKSGVSFAGYPVYDCVSPPASTPLIQQGSHMGLILGTVELGQRLEWRPNDIYITARPAPRSRTRTLDFSTKLFTQLSVGPSPPFVVDLLNVQALRQVHGNRQRVILSDITEISPPWTGSSPVMMLFVHTRRGTISRFILTLGRCSKSGSAAGTSGAPSTSQTPERLGPHYAAIQMLPYKNTGVKSFRRHTLTLSSHDCPADHLPDGAVSVKETGHWETISATSSKERRAFQVSAAMTFTPSPLYLAGQTLELRLDSMDITVRHSSTSCSLPNG